MSGPTGPSSILISHFLLHSTAVRLGDTAHVEYMLMCRNYKLETIIENNSLGSK